MKLVVFGLSVSSSWGNGHATLWRGLIRALARRGWTVTFFERDMPWYAKSRDLTAIEGGRLVLYPDFDTVRREAAREIAEADVAMVTSYCPDAIAATELVLASRGPLKTFYDLDTPVTLDRLRGGEAVDYIGPSGLSGFDLVLSYTGGAALTALETELGARRAAPLYGHVDPDVHRPGAPDPAFAGDLSYLGTYAADRQAGVERFLVKPARLRPDRSFVIGGAQYPQDFPWTDNILFVRHLPPDLHPAFYSSSRFTLNVTRKAMADLGWCPSGRLFEAAACGAAILTDLWPGLGDFFELGREVLPVETTDDVLAALDLSDAEVARIKAAARDRVHADHTSERRARDFEAVVGSSAGPARAEAVSEGV